MVKVELGFVDGCKPRRTKASEGGLEVSSREKPELLKAGDGLLQGLDEPIHFLFRIVEGKGCPGGCGDAEALHEGLAAMVTRADGDALGIQNGGYVVRVDAVDGKGNDGCLARRIPVNGEAGKGFQSGGGLL